MRPGFLILLCAVAFGQVEPPDPFDRAMQLSEQARSRGNSAEAAAQREEARKLLAQVPSDSSQWAFRVQMVAQSYQSSGWHAQARAVVQEALDRAGALPRWNPGRIQLLNSMAEFWWQDGNLLKAVSYREQAVAAFEATPPGAAASTPATGGISTAVLLVQPILTAAGRAFRGEVGRNSAYLYEQLANLYRELGRPEAAARAIDTMRSRLQNDPAALAESYARDGNIDQAVALYQKQAAQAAADPNTRPWNAAAPLEAIASLYVREDRLPEAIAAYQQALARLEAFGDPQATSQATNIHLRMASVLQRSGQNQPAEQIYQKLLSGTRSAPPEQQVRVLEQYAGYLSQNGRGSQGIQALKDFLSSHADLTPWQQANILMNLSQLARQAGQNDAADQYQRQAEEKQRAGQPPQPVNGPRIGPDLSKAQQAAFEGNLDEAFSQGLAAIKASDTALDSVEISFRAPSLANQLASRKAADKGEQIYQALFLALQSRAADTVEPLNQALQQYARFLMGQKDRWGDAALAIDRYEASATAASGAETNVSVQAQRLRVELAQMKQDHAETIEKADELLALEKSLSGPASSRYMRVAQTVVGAYETAGKPGLALPLHREIVSIADRTMAAGDVQRGFVRMNAAMAFATAGQFDEAERLAGEATAVAQAARPPQPDLFRGQAEQIARMKSGLPTSSPPARLGIRGFTPSEIRTRSVAPPR